eukprot:m.463084 g.463084  ORF g.463084 m.463084 type:complete len:98 (+) comp22908_c0_seq1:1086-1379(+)
MFGVLRHVNAPSQNPETMITTATPAEKSGLLWIDSALRARIGVERVVHVVPSQHRINDATPPRQVRETTPQRQFLGHRSVAQSRYVLCQKRAAQGPF